MAKIAHSTGDEATQAVLIATPPAVIAEEIEVVDTVPVTAATAVEPTADATPPIALPVAFITGCNAD